MALLPHRFTLRSTLRACQCARHTQNRQAPRAHGHEQMGSVRHTSPWQQPSCWHSTSFVSGPTVGSWLLNETLDLVKKNNNKKTLEHNLCLESIIYKCYPSACSSLIGYIPFKLINILNRIIANNEL